MLSIAKINSTDYYAHLSATEYYASEQNSNGEPPGRWGAGLESLGIKSGQMVTPELLHTVMMGHAPNGEPLTQNVGKDNQRIGLDLTFSAPKSLSVLWANAQQSEREAISQIHADAIASAMDYIRTQTEARRGKDGLIKETPKALIYATYEHSDTRAKDPQLHTHCVLSNACIRADGTTGTYDQATIFAQKMTAGAIYRQNFAQNLRARGYQITQDPDPKNEGIFAVAGVSDKVVKNFSKRSTAIKAEAKRLGVSSAKSLNKIALYTREAKTETNRAESFERWQEESQSLGFVMDIETLKTAKIEAFVMPTNEQIFEILTDKNSFFETKDLERQLAEYGQFVDFDRAEKMAEILADEQCLSRVATQQGYKKIGKTETKITSSKRVYTSKKLVELEQKIIDSAKARDRETAHHLSDETIKKVFAKFEKNTGRKLSNEQTEAVKVLTQQSGGIAILRGLAGAGKTTALRAVVDAYKAQGYSPVGATISAVASQVLVNETNLKSQTIAQLLIDLDSKKIKFTDKTVLIIDECGMVGSRDFGRLQSYVDDAKAKLLAVGDERQLQAISAGGVFEALQKNANLTTAKIETIRRQQDPEELRATKLFYEGRAGEALEIYEKKGLITTEKYALKIYETLAKDYANDPASVTEKIAIAPTREGCRVINEEIREHLKKSGQIEENGAFFENAEGDLMELAKGDRIILKKNNRASGLINNQTATVESIEQIGDHARIVALFSDGKSRTVDTKDYNHILCGYAITGHASQGSTVQKSFVVFGAQSDQSWAYVGASRHKDQMQIYTTEQDRPALAEKFSTLNAKGTTLDLSPDLAKDTPQVTPTEPTKEGTEAMVKASAKAKGAPAIQQINIGLIKSKSPGTFDALQTLKNSADKDKSGAISALYQSLALAQTVFLEGQERDNQAQKQAESHLKKRDKEMELG